MRTGRESARPTPFSPIASRSGQPAAPAGGTTSPWARGPEFRARGGEGGGGHQQPAVAGEALDHIGALAMAYAESAAVNVDEEDEDVP